MRVSIDGDDLQLREAVIAGGHVLVEVGEVQVVGLRAGIVDGHCTTSRARSAGRPLSPPVPRDIPTVAVIAQRGLPAFDELDRSALEAVADAFVIGPRMLAAAIGWVASEDRAARTTGAPRLVVIGSNHADFGASRVLGTAPLTLGCASTFGVHPQRPDAIPTLAGTVARRHAELRFEGGVIALRDLQSTNGTTILRRGEPARRLVPMEQRSERAIDPSRESTAAWLIHDSSEQWITLQIGDCVQLPGFWRFRVDGDLPRAAKDD